jgi:hypothetical protein
MLKKLPPVAEWMMMTDDQVFDRFYTLPNAFSDGVGLKRFVYVPGTRKDRVLLVAHADTVWPNMHEVINLGYEDGIIYSKNRYKEMEVTNRHGIKVISRGFGIGADDRAGCAIVWALRNLGHSILIVGGEEQGCVATSILMNTQWWRNELNTTHSFAVEFDRRGKNDCVFYRVGTTDFVEYVKSQTGYIPAQGSVTDISHLCRLICGVNLSVGYYDEHRAEEKLVVDQWENTLAIANNWLSKKDLPCYPLDHKKLFSIYSNSKWNNFNADNEEWYNKYKSNHNYTPHTKPGFQKKTETQVPIKGSVTVDQQGNQTLACPSCKALMTDEQWFINHFKCTNCQVMF